MPTPLLNRAFDDARLEQAELHGKLLNDFDVAIFPDKAALLTRIRTAHLKDIDGNPRGNAPDIGAYEAP